MSAQMQSSSDKMQGSDKKGFRFSSKRFRSEREDDWIAFEALLTRMEKDSSSSLSSDELLRLPVLYRAILSSLSIARATTLDVALLDHLESLAVRGYFLIYGVREKRSTRIVKFFLHDWPDAVRALWKETLVIALVILLGVATSWTLAAADPEWFYRIIPSELAQGRGPDASIEYLRKSIGLDSSSQSQENTDFLHVFATFLFTHNSLVAILSFSLGFAFGIPTMILIYTNGLLLGAMIASFVSKGLGIEFGGWLAIHGTTELFAIIVSGAAGLRIGTAILFPGNIDRLTAAAQSGATAGRAMLGVLIMLLIAGLLEGFARQLVTDTGIRYGVATFMLLFWLGYYYWPQHKSQTR